jgi:hypothetical protein
MNVDHSHVFLQFSELGVHFKSESNPEFETITWDKIKKKELILWTKIKIDRHLVEHLTIEIINPDFLLIPFEYDTKLYRHGFLEKALGENTIDGKELHEHQIQWLESNLIFLIPSEWKDFASTLFPLAKINYIHILGELLTEKTYIKGNKSNQLNILLHGKSAFISLFIHGKLQLANVFIYQSSLELAFYLHSIRDSFAIVLNKEIANIHRSNPESDAIVQSLQPFNLFI